MNQSPGSGPTVPLWDLVQTAHLAERRFTEVFAAAGLSPAQYGVLASLADGDDLSQADLARAVLVRPQSMGRLITDMIAAGLVVRDGPGGRGRRANLHLTPAGEKAFAQARPAAYAINTPEALGLEPEQVDVLSDLLATIREHINGPHP